MRVENEPSAKTERAESAATALDAYEQHVLSGRSTSHRSDELLANLLVETLLKDLAHYASHRGLPASATLNTITAALPSGSAQTRQGDQPDATTQQAAHLAELTNAFRRSTTRWDSPEGLRDPASLPEVFNSLGYGARDLEKGFTQLLLYLKHQSKQAQGSPGGGHLQAIYRRAAFQLEFARDSLSDLADALENVHNALEPLQPVPRPDQSWPATPDPVRLSNEGYPADTGDSPEPTGTTEPHRPHTQPQLDARRNAHP
ncbi:hypothetical protein [Spirillospora sp. NPDC047279]|uniref:hypothetical protein n=1 Tax=Spirillospora sp. NPDC047279 TaxID=3155478 RepID=UPI0033DF5742